MSHIPDQGGEEPCFAQLLDRPTPGVDDAVLAQLVRDLGDAVVVSGRRGEILFWNRAAEKLFGWSADEVAGQTLDVIVPERFQGRHWDGYFATMSTGQTKYGDQLLEVPAVLRDGATVSIAFTVTLLTDDSGEVSGIAAVIRDDTERRRERLEAQQRLRSLEARLDPQGESSA